jgi:hypothetical protein
MYKKLGILTIGSLGSPTVYSIFEKKIEGKKLVINKYNNIYKYTYNKTL